MTLRESPAPQRSLSPLVVTFERGGRVRRVRLDARVSLAIGAMLLLIGAWALAATLYLVFRDDAAMSDSGRARERYEERISALRSAMERLSSRRLVEQETVESRLDQLARRQERLEARQGLVAALAESATAKTAIGSIAASAAALKPDTLASRPMGGPLDSVSSFAPAEQPSKPHVLQEDGSILPLLRGSESASGAGLGRTSALWGADQAPGPGAARTVASLDARLADLEGGPERALSALEAKARARIAAAQRVLAGTGLSLSRFADAVPHASASGQGGPLVPLATLPGDASFSAEAERVSRALADASRLALVLSSVPLGRPLAGEPDLSSGFGPRIDPFTRGLALHTGLDFRDAYGTPVRATAPGRVTVAEISGGYGAMVEIDHGAGLSTRYGHLSAILVQEGQRVEAGTVVGRLGSTGRSTGPHLHYETRIDGEPVDPLRFLQAAARFEG